MKNIGKKMIKTFGLALLLASTIFCTAFASTGEQSVPVSTGNVVNDVVYGENEKEVKISTDSVDIASLVIPQVPTFQVKEVRVYPVYINPEDSTYYYNESIYAVNTISGNDWGQVNVLRISPETTEELLNSFDAIGYEVVRWRMEMDCYVANYERPSRFEFVSEDGSETISAGAYNGTRTFVLRFPVQDTTNKYGNGYEGTFSYYATNGNYVSLMAGGLVYLNDTSNGAK